jgi:RNA polymerase sigma-70 factor (ECF subfamily)
MNAPRAAGLSFDLLFQNYYSRLARLLYRVTGDTSRAEEIASEAFWRLHRKPPPDQANVEGWLYRTRVRLALDHLKKERRRARYESMVPVHGAPAGPQEALEQEDARARIRLVLSHLKPEQVALILLRSEGFSYAELASALHINPNSAGTLLARAEEAFRKEYVKRYGQHQPK